MKKPLKIVEMFWDKVVFNMDQKHRLRNPEPLQVKSIEDIAYVPDNDKMHLLDIYYPNEQKDRYPVIFDVHGGGWYYGDKTLNSPYSKSLTQFGFAVVCISYRLIPQTDFYGQMQDCFDALNYIGDHHEEYKLDINNLFLTGDSAGGHIVSLMNNIVKDAALQQFYNCYTKYQWNAVGLTCPALEPVGITPGKLLKNLYFEPVFGEGFMDSDVKNKVNFYDTYLRGTSPIFIISAYHDFLGKQAKTGFKFLKDKGHDVDMIYYETEQIKGHNLQHVYNVADWHWEESSEANRRMCEFFKKHEV